MELGARIAELRIAAGLNQSELGRLLDVTPQAVQAWEKGGGIRPSKFEPLAAALNVSLAMLLLGEEVGPTSQPTRPDPEILAAALKLVRRTFELIDQPHDPETDGEPTSLAYAYLAKRNQRTVTPANIVDFIEAMQGRKGETDEGSRAGGAGAGHRNKGERKVG